MNQPIRVLGIVGSPRRGGNTERLVDDVLRGSQSVGAEIGKIALSDHRVESCLGCLTCYPEGRDRCANHDDAMAAITQRMKEADVWVLGTPVYCYGPTGLFKTFLDRWICFLPEVYENTAVASVIPLNRATLRAEPTLTMLKTTCQSFGLHYLAGLVAPDLLHVADLDRHPEYRVQAAELGRLLPVGITSLSSIGGVS